jgi:reactive intermediate/imine deaminase
MEKIPVQSPDAAAGEKAGRRPIERLPRVTLGGKDLPFSAGVRVGDMLYLSGQIGCETDGTVPQGVEAQARLALDRIGEVLAMAGLGWKDVVRCLVMLKDMGDWPAFNAVYLDYVDVAHLPARSAFGCSDLAMGALLEVQCEAYWPER